MVAVISKYPSTARTARRSDPGHSVCQVSSPAAETAGTRTARFSHFRRLPAGASPRATACRSARTSRAAAASGSPRSRSQAPSEASSDQASESTGALLSTSRVSSRSSIYPA